MNGQIDIAPAVPAALSRPALLAWNPAAAAWILGLMHCAVDTASLAILYIQLCLDNLAFDEIVSLILTYNALAFGLQAPFGLLADRLKSYKLFIVLGLFATAGAVAVTEFWPYTSALAVAMGNAMFHVGGGATVLAGCRGRATRPGIFVGPGAMGVALGLWWGSEGFAYSTIFVAFLAACAILVTMARFPAPPADTPDIRTTTRDDWKISLSIFVAVLLLISVGVRSVTGGFVRGGWPELTGGIALALAGAAVVAKMAGGFLADKIGWRIIGAGVLLLAALLIAVAPRNNPGILIIEMLLIQMTMAVTLTGVYLTMPGRPGLSFGLPSLAIVIGIIPGAVRYWGSDPAIWQVPLTLAAAAMIFAALTLLRKKVLSRPAEYSPGK
ncbi:MAG: hypothetical protein HZA50_05915 [Planctomycetes bacterium]|nr:hypothetical protein [Planctomycetota bacterium]